ncbi:predicted protein [Naegleria gruberi]|uniref:Predicted protein n=1 Tax=Naegleria gruberi TaxID=5762 RepID=D2VKZ5_NAEGR|nr:uncharacterized protein NAEGRDRAFT_83217 [Naegleria gruberi]EFC42530.1 predicted protein [Naegleria gruberi]|eukprot:XP_002675274.1 predicted protein [Naegleria gruberi strain NEG-M]
MNSARESVDIYLSCCNLARMDLMSKSDPFAKLYESNTSSSSGGVDKFTFLGNTETIQNNHNPVFKTKFSVHYYFECVQKFYIEIYDDDGGNKSELIGKTREFSLSQAVCSRDGKLKLDLVLKSGKVQDMKVVLFKCKGIGLDKKDFFGKSDCYFFFEKEVAGRRVKLYTSEVIYKNLNPSWTSFKLNLDEFNNDYNKDIFVTCYDKDKYSKDDLIGEFKYNLDQVLNNNVKQFHLIEPSLQKKKKNYKNSGVFEKENRQDQFLDHIMGGCNISVSVGIDFTASNGGFTSSSSLHYLSSKKNHYQQALAQVLQILEPYDSDKIYGGKYLTFNTFTNYSKAYGYGEILEAYEKAVPRLSFGDMGSATNPKTGKPYRGDDFYRVIEHVVERTPPVTQQQQFYNILLLIIDGDAFDMQGTIDSIIEANDKPISIVIVGIGGRSFPSCRKFDADDEPLIHSNGTKMTRDIVQFVSFSECSDLTQLASEVLAEIPKQMVTYFESKEIIPNPRPQSAFY